MTATTAPEPQKSEERKQGDPRTIHRPLSNQILLQLLGQEHRTPLPAPVPNPKFFLTKINHFLCDLAFNSRLDRRIRGK